MNKFLKGAMMAIVIPMSGAFAQEVAIGLKGGLNFAKLDVSSVASTYDNRTGYNFGAFTLFKFSKIGIQPEILFSQQGSTVKTPNTGSFESNFSYVNIPILLKLYVVGGLNFQIGPQFGFLTNDPIIKDSNGTTIHDAVKKSDTSLALGAGWDLPLRLSIDARYNLGLKDVSNTSGYEAKNQVWQISVGLKLIKLGH